MPIGSSGLTKLAQLINPQVMSAFVQSKLTDNMVFAPLADIGTKLVGTPGNTLTVPSWKYIGDATELGEGVADVPVLLQATSKQVTIKKASKAVELTDEALLSGFGDPVGQAGEQIVTAIANKVDNDCIEALKTLGSERTHTAKAGLTKEEIIKARVKFGEDLAGTMFLFVSPVQYANLLLDKDFVTIKAGEMLVNGHVGQLGGAQIVVSNKIKDAGSGKYTNYLVKSGAIGIELKRDTLVETDRDKLAYTNLIVASKHYIAYLKNEANAVKIECTEVTA